jgi:hypothetical protein
LLSVAWEYTKRINLLFYWITVKLYIREHKLNLLPSTAPRKINKMIKWVKTAYLVWRTNYVNRYCMTGIQDSRFVIIISVPHKECDSTVSTTVALFRSLFRTHSPVSKDKC